MQQRIAWLDSAKGLAILLVVLGHVSFLPMPVLGVIYAFHLPMFFFLSGILLFRKRESFSYFGDNHPLELTFQAWLGNKYLKGADVMAVTSRFECYPTVVNEALCLGVPVVMNDIPVAPEMLSPTNGIITDYDHFADAILAARSLKVEFVDENEEVMKRLEGEWMVVR